MALFKILLGFAPDLFGSGVPTTSEPTIIPSISPFFWPAFVAFCRWLSTLGDRTLTLLVDDWPQDWRRSSLLRFLCSSTTLFFSVILIKGSCSEFMFDWSSSSFSCYSRFLTITLIFSWNPPGSPSSDIFNVLFAISYPGDRVGSAGGSLPLSSVKMLISVVMWLFDAAGPRCCYRLYPDLMLPLIWMSTDPG